MFPFIDYVMLILFGIGIYICYLAKKQDSHLLYNYGFWSFILFFISRFMGIIPLSKILCQWSFGKFRIGLQVSL